MLETYLEELGLSEKEAQVYLALLQVDNDTIHDIAQKTKINRTTVYPVLDSLSKKGLVSEIQDGKKIKYQAAPPERLETYVERQKVLLEEKSRRLKDIIPQIKSIQREQGERPVFKFFSGRDGSYAAYQEFYEDHNKDTKFGYFVYNKDLLNKNFSPAEQDRIRDLRVDKNVEPISVYVNDKGNIKFTTPGKRTRIDQEKYPLMAEITTIGDRVIISTLGDSINSLLIKSKDIATTLSSLIRYINDIDK